MKVPAQVLRAVAGQEHRQAAPRAHAFTFTLLPKCELSAYCIRTQTGFVAEKVGLMQALALQRR